MRRFQPVQPPMLERGLLHEHYQYVEYAPAPRLQHIVCCYWSSVMKPGEKSQWHRIVPDGCIDIIFDLYAVDHRSAFLASLMRSYEVMELTESMAFFGIRLYASEVRGLLGYAGSSLAGTHVTLEQWLGAQAAPMTEDVVTAAHMQERIERTERWLWMLVQEQEDNDTALLRQLVHYIHAEQGRLTVRDLAQQSHYSDRTLRRLFQQELGVSPKEWSDMMRFQAVLRHLQMNDAYSIAMDTSSPSSAFTSHSSITAIAEVIPQSLTLSELAVRFGYYDQSHLNLAFNRYYGLTPGQLLQR